MNPTSSKSSPCFLLYLSALPLSLLPFACIYYRLPDALFYCLSLGLFVGILLAYLAYLWLLSSKDNGLMKTLNKFYCRLYGHSECPEHRRYMGIGYCLRCNEMAYDKKYIKAKTCSGFLPDHDKWEYYGLFRRIHRSRRRICGSIGSFIDKRFAKTYRPDELPF